MGKFQGLVRKDFLLLRGAFFTWMIILFILFMMGVALANYNDSMPLLLGVIAFIYFTHVVLLPGFLYILLREEEKSQYWLHSTSSSITLLLSKLLVSLIYFLVSLFIIDVIALVHMKFFSIQYLDIPGNVIPYREGFFLNGTLIFAGIYFSCWCLFLWTVYHSLTQFPWMKKMRWFIILSGYILFQYVVEKINQLDVVQNLLHYWVIDVKMDYNIGFTRGTNYLEGRLEIPMIDLFISIGFIVLLFYLASKLLDRKVEV
ncbi:hypothetical protein J2S13_000996 [Oikeobacillus pervagus]|uniref:Uncharacterized protein n=1 Tax=Oikeobacillus pervagus TaxID=1325931 RepID=A0AAJ1SXP4_9BACI|nr:hypothetical protein [Oikeobacillus pervagus]MDQ0214600.1 hypothetical protein [Oikeobacillus pervagus]